MQCSKVHVKGMCKNNAKCKNIECTMRHPKKCRSFECIRKCKFYNYAYLYADSESSKKTEELIKVVNEIKYEIRQIAQNIKEGSIRKIEQLETNFIELREDIKKMSEHLHSSEMLILQLYKNYKNNIHSPMVKETDDIKSIYATHSSP